MKYTWEELADSQCFEHGQEFVTLEDYQEIQQRLEIATATLVRSNSKLEAARKLMLGLMKVCDRSMDSEHDYKAFLAMNDEAFKQVSARE